MLKREVVLWDRRKTVVKLTEKGKKLLDKLKKDRIDSIKCVISILGDENIDQFISLFTKYLDAVEGDKNA